MVPLKKPATRYTDPWSIATCKVATAMDLGSALDGSGKSLARFYWLQRHCVSELLVLSFAGRRLTQRVGQAASSKRQA